MEFDQQLDICDFRFILFTIITNAKATDAQTIADLASLTV